MPHAPFTLHPRLAADSVPLGHLELCGVYLAKDANYPWVLLIPERPALREIHDLAAADRILLVTESCAIAQKLQEHTGADKINIAALGNMVPQLHLHHIARFETDIAWPQPIWGTHPPRLQSPQELSARAQEYQDVFVAIAGFVPTARG